MTLFSWFSSTFFYTLHSLALKFAITNFCLLTLLTYARSIVSCFEVSSTQSYSIGQGHFGIPHSSLNFPQVWEHASWDAITPATQPFTSSQAQHASHSTLLSYCTSPATEQFHRFPNHSGLQPNKSIKKEGAGRHKTCDLALALSLNQLCEFMDVT